MEPNRFYRGFMSSAKASGKRQRGEIETLPSGARYLIYPLSVPRRPNLITV